MFNFSIDKRTIYILLGIMAIMTIINYATNQGALLSLILTIPGVLIAITFHEFAHAFAADKLGDDTPRKEGRLSLNTLDHLDPVGSLLLLLAGFGWGKPVNVNPRNYTRKISMELAEAIVSLAGPLMNIILAFIFSLIYCAIYKFAGAGFILSTIGNVIILLLQVTISVNIGLGVFNLIPLPPLDGSKIIMPLLPYKAKQCFVNNERIFYIIFVVIWITGIAGYIVSPVVGWVSTGIINLARLIFKI